MSASAVMSNFVAKQLFPNHPRPSEAKLSACKWLSPTHCRTNFAASKTRNLEVRQGSSFLFHVLLVRDAPRAASATLDAARTGSEDEENPTAHVYAEIYWGWLRPFGERDSNDPLEVAWGLGMTTGWVA